MQKYTQTELIKCTIQPERTIVKDIFVGNTVSILSADPKIGKTTIAIQFANAISRGEYCLERETQKNKVIYFCLDDNAPLIKSRLKKMNMSDNDDLHFIFFDSCSMTQLNDTITELKVIDSNIGFVIVDMLNDVRTIDSNNEYSNAAVKKDINALRDIAEKLKVCILLLHHNRKADASNKNNKLMGGIQLTGSINGSILTLTRTSPQSFEASLEISGRNVSPNIVPLKFNPYELRFELAEQPINELETNMVKILNFVQIAGEFTGTVQDLCAQSNILVDPRKIGKLLKQNITEFEENGVLIAHRKSNGKRFIEMKLKSDFKLNKGPSVTSVNILSTDAPLTLEEDE